MALSLFAPSDLMDFHSYSLRTYEAWQLKQEQAEAEASQHQHPTFYIKTPDWEEYANSEHERDTLYNDAIMCGYHPSQVTVETLPF